MAGMSNQGEMQCGAIMVVEDDPEMRALLQDFLEQEGYRVIDRVSGEQALKAIESEEFTAVILDKEIPCDYTGAHKEGQRGAAGLHCPHRSGRYPRRQPTVRHFVRRVIVSGRRHDVGAEAAPPRSRALLAGQ